MSVGISDNITELYRLQQCAKQNPNNQQIVSTSTCNKQSDGELSRTQKTGIGICTAIGVIGSLMLLAKLDKSKAYTINPLKMFKGNIKDSFLAKTKYNTQKIVTIGSGSIIGGLVGGAIFGKKEDSKSRIREGIVQIANITAPIALVEALSLGGDKLSNKLMPNWCASKNFFKQAVTKLPPAVGAMAGLVTGMYIGNRLSNKINEKIFNVKDDRPMKWKDFSAHIDDIGVASTFVAPDNIITKAISRVIPLALFVPGYETGTKTQRQH